MVYSYLHLQMQVFHWLLLYITFAPPLRRFPHIRYKTQLYCDAYVFNNVMLDMKQNVTPW